MSPTKRTNGSPDTEPLPTGDDRRAIGRGDTVPDAYDDDDAYDTGDDGESPRRRVPNWRPGPGRPERTVPRTAVVVVVLALVLLILAASVNLFTGAIDRLNPFRNGIVQEQTVDRSGPAVLKSISDLGEFRAASGYYELVVDVEKDVKPVPAFLAGERTLFVAAGNVDSTVDFRNLKDGAVEINAERTKATITLPKPTLSEPVINTDRSYVYERQRGLANRLKDAFGSNPGQEQELYGLAKQKLAAAAAGSPELTTRGEATTRAMLVGLLTSLGFTDVTVNFTADPGL